MVSGNNKTVPKITYVLMPRTYPEVLLQERDRLRVVVKYQWIAIALLTTATVWAIIFDNILFFGGSL